MVQGHTRVSACASVRGIANGGLCMGEGGLCMGEGEIVHGGGGIVHGGGGIVGGIVHGGGGIVHAWGRGELWERGLCRGLCMGEGWVVHGGGGGGGMNWISIPSILSTTFHGRGC